MEVDTKPSVGGHTSGAAGGSGAGTAAAPCLLLSAGQPQQQTSVTVALHPLVIMNVSEHWTRIKAQQATGTPQQVIGIVIGKQNGRNLELMNSFELPYEIIGGDLVYDAEFFRTREAQYKEVFPSLDFMGWYTTGGEDVPTQSDSSVHRHMCDVNESPVLLKLNPTAVTTDKLPIRVFESVIDLVKGEAVLQFIEVPWSLATEEAERIGVDHVARISTASAYGGVSSATKQLVANQGAVKMLHGRLELLVEYLKAVDDGTLTPDQDILRDVASLCQRLPLMDGQRFKTDFTHQCCDIKLMAYLGSLTKTSESLNQLIAKLNVLSERQWHGGIRRGRGLMM